MATEMKKVTITVSSDMKNSLDVVRREQYGRDTQEAMLRDLITRGLKTLGREVKNACEQSEILSETGCK